MSKTIWLIWPGGEAELYADFLRKNISGIEVLVGTDVDALIQSGKAPKFVLIHDTEYAVVPIAERIRDAFSGKPKITIAGPTLKASPDAFDRLPVPITRSLLKRHVEERL